LGDLFWGHFLFILREKVSGKILATYESDSPPWAYNGIGPKDSRERIQSIPHPFADFRDDGLPAELEIVLVDFVDVNLKAFQDDLGKDDRSIREGIERIALGKPLAHSRFGLGSMPGFSDKVTIRKAAIG
jgi:hypothetical protein